MRPGSLRGHRDGTLSARSGARREILAERLLEPAGVTDLAIDQPRQPARAALAVVLRGDAKPQREPERLRNLGHPGLRTGAPVGRGGVQVLRGRVESGLWEGAPVGKALEAVDGDQDSEGANRGCVGCCVQKTVRCYEC